MPIATCTISGTTLDAHGQPKAGVKVFVVRIEKSGTVFEIRNTRVATSDANGAVSFAVPRDCNIWLQGSFRSGSTNFSPKTGVAKAVPDAATATLEALGDAVTLTAQAQPLDADLSQIAALNPSNDDFLQRKAGVWTNRTPAQVAADLPIGGGAWGTITGTLSDQADLQSALDAKQALDSDLTAIAALSASNDDIIQRKAGAWTNRTLAQLLSDLNLGAAYQPLDAELSALAGLTSAANKVPYFTGSGAAAVADFTAYGRSIVAVADEAALKALINLEIGTDVQAFDSDLSSIGGLSPSNDDFLQRKAGAWANRTVAQVKTDLGLTGTNSGDQTISLTGDVTGSGTGSFTATIANDAVTFAKMQNIATARILGRTTASSGDIEELDASAVRSLLSLVIGTNVQAWDADLDTIAGLSASNDDFLQRKSGAWANRTISQVKSDLGLTGTNSGDQNLFGSIIVAGQTTVTASANPTALTLVEGSNVTITTNNTTKEITIAASGGGGGGITNSAADTELMISDGANAVGDPGLTFADSTLTVGGSILTGSGAANSNTILHPEGPTSAESEQKIFVDHTSTTPAPGSPVDAFWPASILALTTVDISDDDDAEIDNLYRSSVAGTIRVPSSNDKDFSPLGHLSGVTAISLFEGTGSAPKVIGLYANAINTSPVEIIYGAGAQVLNDGNATYSAGIGIFAEAHSGATIGELVGADVYVTPSSGSVVTDTFGVRISHAAGAGAATNLYGLVIEDFSGGGAVTRNENFRSKGSTSVNVFEGALISGAASPPTLSNGQFTFTLDEANDQVLFTVKYSDGTDKTGAIPLA